MYFIDPELGNYTFATLKHYKNIVFTKTFKSVYIQTNKSRRAKDSELCKGRDKQAVRNLTSLPYYCLNYPFLGVKTFQSRFLMFFFPFFKHALPQK